MKNVYLHFRKLVKINPTVGKLLIESSLALLVKVLGALSVLIMNFIVARSLGLHESGYFFLGLMVVYFLGAVTRCGFDNVVLRYTASSLQNENVSGVGLVFSFSVVIIFFVSFAMSLILYAYGDLIANNFFNKPDFGASLVGFSFAVTGTALTTILAYSFQGMAKVSLAILVMNVSNNFLLIIFMFLLDVDKSSQAAFLYSTGSIINFVLFLIIWVFSTFKMKAGMRRKKARPYDIAFSDMWRSAKPLWVVLIMTQLIQWTGQMVGGVYLSPGEISQLAIAQRTSMVVSLILMAVNMVVAPRFAALHSAGDIDGLKNVAHLSVILMGVAALPIVSAMLIFPEALLMLFGDGYASGAIFLQVLAIGQFVNVVTGSVAYLLTMSGHERDLRNTLLVVAPLSVGITLVLVPIFGALGAALATALAVSSQNLFAVYWVKRRLGFNTVAVWRFKSS